MDPRFFKAHESLDFSAIVALLRSANLLSATHDLPNMSRHFQAFKPLKIAGPDDLSFFHNARYAQDLTTTRAGLVLVPDDADLPALDQTTHVVRVLDVHRALALVGQAFLIPPAYPPGIDPTAQIDPTARVDPTAHIGPQVVIGAATVVGAGTYLMAQVVVGDGVVIGADCRIDPQVTLSHALIGDRVHLKPGAKIGQRGFGWALSPQGHVAKPQVGRVLIGHDVEIGANTAIDRGSVEDTEIGDGTVIDNLCHIAHNCKIGRFCALAANTAFAGTTVLGDYVQIGGAVASKGHVTVGQGAVVRISSFIGTNIAPGQDVAGNPARPILSYQRLLRHWSRMARGVKGP